MMNTVGHDDNKERRYRKSVSRKDKENWVNADIDEYQEHHKKKQVKIHVKYTMEIKDFRLISP